MKLVRTLGLIIRTLVQRRSPHGGTLPPPHPKDGLPIVLSPGRGYCPDCGWEHTGSEKEYVHAFAQHSAEHHHA